MPYTITPPQLGFIPSGINQDSELIIGRDPTVAFEGVGTGPGGRPDTVQKINFYMTRLDTNIPTKVATISIDATGIYSIISTNPNAPQNFFFQMREFAVCESGVEKRAVFMASQNYLPA